MSSGKIHVRASLILASAFSVGAIITSSPEMLECAAGAVVGTFISPDLDVDKAFIGDKIVLERTGWIGKKMWMFFWKPYKTSFKHGRFASHFPIFSTFTRIAYVYFWLMFLPHLLIFLLFNPHWDLIYVLTWYAKIFLHFPFFYGLASSDTIHYFLDILTTNSE